MSTRASIIIQQHGKTVASLYRHYDGYPGETGADLLTTLKTLTANGARTVSAAQYARALLIMTYDPGPRPMFRIEAIPGDIEHFYKVNFCKGEQVKIYHAARPSWEIDLQTWTKTGKWYTPAAFAVVVNQGRQQMNIEIAHLKATDPFFKDAELYPMITW